MSNYEIQVVSRAIRVLETLAEAHTALGVSEVADRLGLSKNAAFRLLYTLEKSGCVEKNPETKAYCLGIKLFELGSSVIQTEDLRQLAMSVLESLQEEHQETVNLAMIHEGQVLYVERLESPQTLRTSTTVGTRAPAHSTSIGKALLAHVPRQEVEAILAKHGMPRRTPRTICDVEHLMHELEVIRRRGYAIDKEENIEGVRCIGAPVFDRHGRPIAAISISGPAHRLVDEERLRRVSDSVVSAARELSRKLGWVDDSSP